MGFEPLATFSSLTGLGGMFSLGVLHALEPGHGKVFIGGYFANQSARPRDAVLLSVLLTIFQSLSMMLLAVGLAYASYALFQHSMDAVFERWVDVLGGVFMALMGGLMLLHQRQHHKSREACCQAEHSSDSASKTPSRHSFKSLLLMSFIWGLLPCPIALSAIVSAWGTGTVPALMTSVLMFSLGVGSILLTSSLCFVYASHLIQHRLKRFEPVLNRLYNLLAVGFIALGGFYAVSNLLTA